MPDLYVTLYVFFKYWRIRVVMQSAKVNQKKLIFQLFLKILSNLRQILFCIKTRDEVRRYKKTHRC
jgi:hypothetical protein